ncbi:hypothetical protein Gohar_024601, partial [Gossypium harknessii]|nr:hypothetical protein [Gossypium harknessii]
ESLKDHIPVFVYRYASNVGHGFLKNGSNLDLRKILGFDEKINGFGGNFGIFSAWREEGQLEELDDAPLTVELQQICSESQFDRVIAEAQQLEESLIIL